MNTFPSPSVTFCETVITNMSPTLIFGASTLVSKAKIQRRKIWFIMKIWSLPQVIRHLSYFQLIKILCCNWQKQLFWDHWLDSALWWMYSNHILNIFNCNFFNWTISHHIIKPEKLKFSICGDPENNFLSHEKYVCS